MLSGISVKKFQEQTGGVPEVAVAHRQRQKASQQDAGRVVIWVYAHLARCFA